MEEVRRRADAVCTHLRDLLMAELNDEQRVSKIIGNADLRYGIEVDCARYPNRDPKEHGSLLAHIILNIPEFKEKYTT